jgi:hypothetical protein
MDAGRKLGVGAVLTGTVTRRGDAHNGQVYSAGATWYFDLTQ